MAHWSIAPSAWSAARGVHRRSALRMSATAVLFVALAVVPGFPVWVRGVLLLAAVLEVVLVGRILGAARSSADPAAPVRGDAGRHERAHDRRRPSG